MCCCVWQKAAAIPLITDLDGSELIGNTKLEGEMDVFFPSKSDIDTFYQFTVALIVFKKKKKNLG